MRPASAVRHLWKTCRGAALTPNDSADANAARADAPLVAHTALVVAAVVAGATGVRVLLEAVLVADDINVVAATRKKRKFNTAVGHRRSGAAAVTDVEALALILCVIGRGAACAPADPVARLR